jgi:hypothetical protein
MARRLWAGAEDGALFRNQRRRFETFQTGDIKASHAIWSLLAEDDGTVWIGHFRGGLLRFRDGKFTRFSINEGLPDNIICQILRDDAGNLWLGSHQGIFRVAKSALNDFARGGTNSVPAPPMAGRTGCLRWNVRAATSPRHGADRMAGCGSPPSKAPFRSSRKKSARTFAAAVVIEEILIDGKSLDASHQGAEKPVPARIGL